MKKKSLNGLIILFLICLSCSHLQAQQTATYANENFHYLEGVKLFDQGLYGPAAYHFTKFLEKDYTAQEEQLQSLATLAELYIARAAVRSNAPEAESLVLDFIQTYNPDPIVSEATFEIADFYYSDKNYEKAIAYFELLNPAELSDIQKSEAIFKQGYCHFVMKEFEDAKMVFDQIKNERTTYYYPTNYYLGMTQFFEHQYSAALQSFERVSKSEMYKTYVPYHIVQIQFAEKNYDDVIATGEKSLKMNRLHNIKEIHHLVGKAYYETGHFAEALPHLEYYESKAGKMRAEDFYQLGYVQYQLGMCQKAAQNFKQLHNLESTIAQQAHYYMGDCYVQNGDYTSARTAFKAASQLKFDTDISQEATFNFGKLSYEMNYDHEAIESLQSIAQNSKFYNEAQNILKSLFIHTRDYQNAILTLEKMPQLSPSLQEAYQRVTFQRAIQLYSDSDLKGANELLDKSLKYTPNKEILAQSYFWKGEIAHLDKRFDESISLYQQYFSIATSQQQLPAMSGLSTAAYNQGYNYLKKDQYQTALQHFEKSIKNYHFNKSGNEVLKQMYADALLRSGDCAFKGKDYSKAMHYYDLSISGSENGHVFAIFQKAKIKGLQGETFNKIALLNEIGQKYPRSEYMDDALLELAITYQENGNSAGAIQTFNEITDRYNQNPTLVSESYLRLGLISYNQGDVESALTFYQKIFEQNPNPRVAKEAIHAIEEIYIRDLGQPDAFVQFMDKLPGYQVSDFRKDSLSFIAAETKYELAKYPEAIQGYSAYLKKHPNGVYKLNALYHRAESYGVQEQYTDALKDYESVITLGQSQFYESALGKAAKITYNHEQDFNQALSYYQSLERSATTDENKFEAQLGALRSAYRLNRIELLNELSTKVIENGAATTADRAIAYFYRGKTAFDEQLYDDALADFNEVVKRSSNLQAAESRYRIAQIYYLKEAYDVAEQLCLNVNKENANYPDWVARSIILLSDIHVQRNDLFNARAALEAILENYDRDPAILEEANQKLEAIKSKEATQNRIAPQASKSRQLQLIENN